MYFLCICDELKRILNAREGFADLSSESSLKFELFKWAHK